MGTPGIGGIRMKNWKARLLLAALAALMIVFCGYALAENVTTIRFEPQGGKTEYFVGDTIAIDVRLANNPGDMTSFVAAVDYDADVLEYKGIDYSGSILKYWPTKIWTQKYKQIYAVTNSKSQYVSGDGLICTLTFTALRECDAATIAPGSIVIRTANKDMTGYQYETASAQVLIKTPTSISVPVKEITLDKTSLMLMEGQTGSISATVKPENATNKTVRWSSNNRTVASVDANGTVTAQREGKATITAKAGNYSASCEVIVQREGAAIATGYTVDIRTPEQEIASRENASATISIGVGTQDAEKIQQYNAFDVRLIYDPAMLHFDGVSQNASDCEITHDEIRGVIRLQRFGGQLALGDAFTLNFTALDDVSGDAKVLFENVYVDNDANALLSDAPPAGMLHSSVTFHINSGANKYRVKLPDEYSYNPDTADPEQDYTFVIRGKGYYDYRVTASIGGKTITLTDSTASGADGTYILKKEFITGNITIGVVKSAKTFLVNKEGTGASDVALTNDGKAAYGKDYEFTLSKATGYSYALTIKRGNEKLSGIMPTRKDSVFTYKIPGAEITDKLTISVEKTKQGGTTGGGTTGGGTKPGGTTGGTTTPTPQPTANVINIRFTGSGVGSIDGAANVPAGSDYRFTLRRKDDCDYKLTATMGGQDAEIIDNGDGSYTVQNVTDALTINIEETQLPKLETAIYEYVKLDGKNMYLITAKGEPGEGKIYTYGGKAMYWSDRYKAYCYLIISDKDEDVALAEARDAITAESGARVSVVYDGDINGSRRVDINDAQMVYGMYNARYERFSIEASIMKFLKADMASDGNSAMKLDVADAAALVNMIR